MQKHGSFRSELGLDATEFAGCAAVAAVKFPPPASRGSACGRPAPLD
jgi:hypothetical protein